MEDCGSQMQEFSGDGARQGGRSSVKKKEERNRSPMRKIAGQEKVSPGSSKSRLHDHTEGHSMMCTGQVKLDDAKQ